jgi:hypothetical protein
VMERPRLGFPFARSAAAQVNYSCVQIEHAILRRHRITGAVQSGNSVTHSVADATRNWCFPRDMKFISYDEAMALGLIRPRRAF